ncbi:hypothetical protein TRIATDRAFT_217898 [Trichoderma atroviride IMI 206040]|uniref:Uncharacterized protein n=2 Tax=Hypocrea atroviridis TaxID=63577 RepID=G9NQF5_HYPAI|nr:uncharacterized protein TRIATDRAFT_217898 [Trichoderma atroviride IMI 206040]EHK47297.1 hypothetical protein TRIATDRAFT_217898 [Trichoderma atroviride IMI 206040]
MRIHPYGWGLYKKVTTHDIHPGSCGYFDLEGDWKSIIDLSSEQDLISQGWKIPDDEIFDNNGPGSATWGPKTSSSVQSCSIGGTVKADNTVASLKTSITVSYKSNSSQGAVLFTESPILRHQIGSEASALQWMSENSSEMMRRHKQIIKDRGVWIVTKIYSTRRCAIAIMTGRSSSVEINLDNSQGLLTLAPSSAWTNSSGSSCTELHEDENRVVVFISGIYFSKKPLRSKLSRSQGQEKQKDKIFRGSSDESTDEDDTNNELNVEWYPNFDEDDEGEESDDEFT